MKTQEYFCKRYFNLLRTFVNYSCETLITEKDIMLAIEEFYHITAQDSVLYARRNELVEQTLLETNDADSKLQRTDVEIVQSILVYFGISTQASLSLASMHEGYRAFLQKAKVRESINMLEPADFFLFSLIRLTCLLRVLWSNYDEILSNYYIEPQPFSLPEQELKVCIITEQPTVIYRDGQEITPELNHLGCDIAYTTMVRKYENFHVEITFGNKNEIHTTVSMKEKLAYNHWHSVLKIVIPVSYPRRPITWQIKELDNKC